MMMMPLVCGHGVRPLGDWLVGWWGVLFDYRRARACGNGQVAASKVHIDEATICGLRTALFNEIKIIRRHKGEVEKQVLTGTRCERQTC